MVMKPKGDQIRNLRFPQALQETAVGLKIDGAVQSVTPFNKDLVFSVLFFFLSPVSVVILPPTHPPPHSKSLSFKHEHEQNALWDLRRSVCRKLVDLRCNNESPKPFKVQLNTPVNNAKYVHSMRLPSPSFPGPRPDLQEVSLHQELHPRQPLLLLRPESERRLR